MSNLKKDKKIAFTVPHGCSKKTPVCDENADLIALKTAEILNCENVFLSRQNRLILDMNRNKSRNSAFRKHIKNFIDKYDAIIFDTHSFPNEYQDFGNVDIAVFDMSPSKDDKISRFFVKEFKKNGFKTSLICGLDINDIIVTTLPTDLGILVEFRDTLNIDKTAKIFATIIKKFLRVAHD